jgi:DNA-binding transcriptional MerR regulator
VPKRRVAALLGISVTALQRWIRSGLLPVVRRVGGRRNLPPNQSAEELRAAYLHSTPLERLREAAELSFAVTTLARYGARRRTPAADGG